MSFINVFTSSAPNYVGKVRALFHSLQQHCPDLRTHWLIADYRRDDLVEALADDPIDKFLFLDDFDQFRDPGWCFKHDIIELSTAIKPTVAKILLEEEGCDAVLYFDPDQVVFSSLEDLVEALLSSSAVFTPHLLRPEDNLKAIEDNELCAMRHGIYNLGFFGVRDCAEGHDLLEWWSDRCLRFCWADLALGVFTDQKWIDFVPSYYPDARILRSPRFNVAPWNIGQRHVEGSFDEGFVVEGESLGFYHFTGFDRGAHRMVLDYWVKDNESLFMLIDWYEKRTRLLTPDLDLSWGLGQFENGQEVSEDHRVLYRKRLDLQQAFANPFAVESVESDYLAWFEYHREVR